LLLEFPTLDLKMGVLVSPAAMVVVLRGFKKEGK
jgi:hypothetical protein